jgi:hypothetical protein
MNIDQSPWKIGDRVGFPNSNGQIHPFYGVWVVHEIQDRGLVVSLKTGSHKHLMEWKRVEKGNKL